MQKLEIDLPEKLENLNSPLLVLIMQLYKSLSFGEVIKIIRTAQNLKLKDLEHSAGIGLTVLSKLENGKIKETTHYARKIGAAFEIPWEYLLVFAMDPEKMSERKKNQYYITIKQVCYEYIYKKDNDKEIKEEEILFR